MIETKISFFFFFHTRIYDRKSSNIYWEYFFSLLNFSYGVLSIDRLNRRLYEAIFNILIENIFSTISCALNIVANKRYFYGIPYEYCNYRNK